MSKRIGIDVGGTFTDFVLLDRLSGKLHHHKQPSTPSDPSIAVKTGVKVLMDRAGIAPSEVELIVHGTTISLNTLLQRGGAKVALVVSNGACDILELARIRMAHSFDFFAKPEMPLVPRERVLGIRARIGTDGEIVESPDTDEYEHIGSALSQMDVDVVVVVVLNSHINSTFEKLVADKIRSVIPDLPIVASAEIWPEAREYERAMIAVMNGYIEPIMRNYYNRIERIFHEAGFDAPLSITASNGGTIDLDTARKRPIDTILSGPAAGVVAAAETSRQNEIREIVTFDMGGTSADIAVIENGAPDLTTETHIGEMPLILPVVNVSAIGAGGGSIIRVDADGFLKVGPTSAGADPGPACYGRGGQSATITDCYLICGFLEADKFLGGALPLQKDQADTALQAVAEGLGYSGEDANARAAEAAIKVASSMMATEVRKLLARRGSDASKFTLVPYGGAGSTHAALMANEAGIDQILIPKTPATFCALGAVVAKLRRDFVRSRTIQVDSSGKAGEQLAEEISSLISEATMWQQAIGERADHWQFDLSAEVRYPGQAFALSVKHENLQQGEDIAQILRALFQQKHQKLYGFVDEKSPVEVAQIVVSAVGNLSPVSKDLGTKGKQQRQRRRRVFLAGEWRDIPCIERETIAVGAGAAGPLSVEQSDTTIIVPENWQMTCLDSGDLLLKRIRGTR